MKLIINYDYYFLLLKKLERLESKLKMLEKYKDDYKRMKDNFDSKVDVIENLHKEIDRLNNIINEAKDECKSVIEDSEHTTVSEFNINGLMRTILNILSKGDNNE